MGACILTSRSKDSQTMQGSVVRMARSGYPENRVVEGARQEAATFGKVNANAMKDDCADCRQDRYPVFGKISKAVGRGRNARK